MYDLKDQQYESLFLGLNSKSRLLFFWGSLLSYLLAFYFLLVCTLYFACNKLFRGSSVTHLHNTRSSLGMRNTRLEPMTPLCAYFVQGVQENFKRINVAAFFVRVESWVCFKAQLKCLFAARHTKSGTNWYFSRLVPGFFFFFSWCAPCWFGRQLSRCRLLSRLYVVCACMHVWRLRAFGNRGHMHTSKGQKHLFFVARLRQSNTEHPPSPLLYPLPVSLPVAVKLL